VSFVPDPVLVVVDVEAEGRELVDRELRDRYGRHYRVESFASALEGRTFLEELAAAGDEVALVITGRESEGLQITELLEASRRLHPHARRAVLYPFGEMGESTTGDEIFDAIARGEIDHYVRRPSSPPDEYFHYEISGLLLEWTDAQRVSPHTVYVVGESWSGRAYELREALGRCALPHSFCLADSSAGKEFIAQAGGEGTKLPLVVFPGGKVLVDPSNADLAIASGSPVNPEKMEFDLVIVGAGPAGLSAAVYGASEGFSTLVVDEGGLGGQATSSSLIRNYLGFPRGVSGRRLAQSAYAQAWVFGAKFAFIQRVVGLEVEGEGLAVELSDFGKVTARAVLLATGATWRRIGIPELEALNGSGVYYGGPASEAPGMVGRDVYVLGGANSAGQSALYLGSYARHVTLVVRGDSLGDAMSHYLVQQVEAAPNIDVRLRTEVVGGGGDGVLEHLVLRDRDGNEEVVPADALFLTIGAQPNTGWLPETLERDEQGFVLTGPDLGDDWPLDRPPMLFETSVPGVFAAGDVRHSSVKRVASAVGEGSVVIQMLHQYFAADQQLPSGRHREVSTSTST
jgi:thioredoxin reductase (NADPH)